jgi:hypothetical protein
MARLRERIPLEDGLKLDLNSLLRQRILEWTCHLRVNQLGTALFVRADSVRQPHHVSIWRVTRLGAFGSWVGRTIDRSGGRAAPFWRSAMVFPVSSAGAPRECPVDAARGASFRVPTGMGPPDRLPVAIQCAGSSRALSRPRHSLPARRRGVHGARRPFATQAARNASAHLRGAARSPQCP